MAALTSKTVAAYRDERLKRVKPATVIRELAMLSAIINHARREWDINIANPIALIRKPTAPQGRDRILSAEEEISITSDMLPRVRTSLFFEQFHLPALTLLQMSLKADSTCSSSLPKAREM